MTRRYFVCAVLSALAWFAPAIASAQQPKATGDAERGKWTNFTEEFNKVSGPEKNFRLAIVVDRATGNLFISRWFTGVWVSGDKAKTFTRADGDKINGGGPFSCYAMIAHPEGGKLAAFNMNNKPGPSAYSVDGGKNWESFESVGRNWDYGAIDWSSKAVLAFRHEHDGVHFSPDFGKTWTQLEQLKRGSLTGLGIFSPMELVVGDWKGIQRSDDGGKTWAQVAPYRCTGTVQVFKGVGYWLCNSFAKDKRWTATVLASKDKGKTWKELGKPIGDTMVCCGPFFGKDEKHLVVATLKGIMESVDAGETWKTVTDYPANPPPFGDHKNGCGFPSMGFDPAGNAFYVFLPNMKKWEEGQLYKYLRQ